MKKAPTNISALERHKGKPFRKLTLQELQLSKYFPRTTATCRGDAACKDCD